MSTDEIVDPTIAPSDQFRRFLFHIGIPVAGVVSVIAIIAGVGWHSYQTARTGALALTHDLLVSQQDYIAKEVSSFLMPASAGAIVARDMLEHGAANVEQKIFNGYSSTMLRNVPQIQSFYLPIATAISARSNVARTIRRRRHHPAEPGNGQGHVRP